MMMRGVNDLSMMMKFVMCLGWYRHMLSGQGQQDRGEQVYRQTMHWDCWQASMTIDGSSIDG